MHAILIANVLPLLCRLACMYVCDCAIPVWIGLHTHTQSVSQWWKPAKQAALERACFVSLSAG